MNMTVEEMVIWGVIGLLAGSLAGVVVKGRKEGFGLTSNLLFGLIGAFVGGAALEKLDFSFGLQRVVVDMNNVLAAFIGSLAIVLGAKFIENRKNAGDK